MAGRAARAPRLLSFGGAETVKEVGSPPPRPHSRPKRGDPIWVEASVLGRARVRGARPGKGVDLLLQAGAAGGVLWFAALPCSPGAPSLRQVRELRVRVWVHLRELVITAL